MKTQKESYQLQKLQYLIQAIETTHPPIKTLMFRSFIQGIFVGLGTTIGVSIIVAVLTFAIAQLKIIPGFNNVLERSNIQEILKR